MSGIAVVASAQDAKFAEDVRAGLWAAGLNSSVSPSLPQVAGTYVVLLWSAALEAAHAIDAQALIGLWSEDRLVTVRRDATPLPLGLRDLPSLPPASTVADICAAVPGARRADEGLLSGGDVEQISIGSMPDLAGAPRAGAAVRTGSTGGQEVELEFWRAIKDGNDPDDFELYVQQYPTGIYAALAKREIARLRAERKQEETRPEVPGAKLPVSLIASVLVAIAAVAGGGWYYFNKASLAKQAALTAALEQATKAAQELQAAQAAQLKSLKDLEDAKKRELEAIESGDQAEIRKAQEAFRRAEAEAAKQAEAVKAREAAAADARKKAQEGAERAKSAAIPAAKAPQAAVAVVPAPAAVEAPKAEAGASVPSAAPAMKRPEVPMARSRSERERAVDDAEFARKSAVAKSAPPTSPQYSVRGPEDEGVDSDTLYQQALALERDGNVKDAVRIYRRAARRGSGKAALRLGEIYDKGIPEIPRDYAESLQWYETARQLGEFVPMARGRGGSGGPVVAAPAPAPAPVPRPVRQEPLKAAEPSPVLQPAATPEPPKVAVPAPAAVREAPKAAAPAPAPEPAKSMSPPPAPEPEEKPGWFARRGVWILLVVVAFIVWRRWRRRAKSAAGQEQRQLEPAKVRGDVTTMAAARPVRRPQSAPQGDGTLFVSYSHKDRPRVEPIVSVIEEMGRRVWMDRSDITGKTGWAGQIVRAIRECHAVVLMASPNSYTSDQVVRELYLAMNHKKTIVPIEIEPAEMPDELQYILAPFHHHRLSGGEPREVIGRALAAV